MNYQQLYQEKKASLEDCLAMIDSNTAICMGGDCNEPVAFCLMWEKEMFQLCKRFILEVNLNLPRIRGGLEINIQDVTALYETDGPIATIPASPVGEVEERISQNVASLVR